MAKQVIKDMVLKTGKIFFLYSTINILDNIFMYVQMHKR